MPIIILLRLFPHCNALSTGPISSVTQFSNLSQTTSRSRVSVYDIDTDIYRKRKFDYCAFFFYLFMLISLVTLRYIVVVSLNEFYITLRYFSERPECCAADVEKLLL